MVSREEFEEAVRAESTVRGRITTFGALLAKATRLGASLVVVGGSAISVRTSGTYVSEDIDVVGPKTRIVPVLKRWGFSLDEKERPYWVRADLGLVVDIAGPKHTGHRPEVIETRYGPVRIAAPEDLIVRRLIFAKRDADPRYLNEAALVLRGAGAGIDFGYLEALVRYEQVEDVYRELRRREAGAGSSVHYE